MMTRKLAGIFFTIILLSLFSCGNDDEDDADENTQNEEQQQSEGFFSASLLPVNPVINNEIRSNNRISIVGDEVAVNMEVSGVAPGFSHKQHVHIGRSCPTLADDTNQDGLIDAVEARERTGGVLIPLDADLNGQEGGNNSYPIATSRGSYTYLETASLVSMLSDLTAPDPDPNDELIKLDSGDVLNVEGAVLEIHGIPPSVNLPSTVAALPGETPHQSFPVACGLLRQTASTTSGGTIGGGSIGGTAGGTSGSTIGGTSGGSVGGTSGGGEGPVSCEVDIQILCPIGSRDGCETGQTTTHRCVREQGVSCEEDIRILCPRGSIDGCETGQTRTHQCVRQHQEPGISCEVDIAILCPAGFRDGCETGQTSTHQCVRKEQEDEQQEDEQQEDDYPDSMRGV